jgi:transketolase
MTQITAQWLINTILAIGNGQTLTPADQDKLAAGLCQTVKNPQGPVTLSIGRVKVFCSNAPRPENKK